VYITCTLCPPDRYRYPTGFVESGGACSAVSFPQRCEAGEDPRCFPVARSALPFMAADDACPVGPPPGAAPGNPSQACRRHGVSRAQVPCPVCTGGKGGGGSRGARVCAYVGAWARGRARVRAVCVRLRTYVRLWA
jgi:hypothetical protein